MEIEKNKRGEDMILTVEWYEAAVFRLLRKFQQGLYTSGTSLEN